MKQMKVVHIELPPPETVASVVRFYDAVMHVNEYTIRIGSEVFIAGCGQFTGIEFDFDKQRFRLKMARFSQTINNRLESWNVDTAAIQYGPRPYHWLTDAELVMIGAMVIEADEPQIVFGGCQ